jgi:hypothetical protein
MIKHHLVLTEIVEGVFEVVKQIPTFFDFAIISSIYDSTFLLI